MIRRLNREEIRAKYNSVIEIWDKSDQWSTHSRRNIEFYVAKLQNIIEKKKGKQGISILNAGSGGDDYGLSKYGSHVHVDVAENRLKSCDNFVVASIENLPFEDNSFDVCVCVGSVINYCDAIKSLSELARTLKVGGHLLLEFESSKSHEFMFSSSFDKPATIVKTFYNGTMEYIWVYSPSFILKDLELNGFTVTDERRFHLLSPLLYKITKNEILSARFACFDPFLRQTPYLRKVSANVILICEKTG
jgi:ubiquinone/menaquinone biosynthesis C-methylase UbiE